MNKKAIFMPTLAIATLFLLTYATYVFIVKDPGINKVYTIGDNQIALSNAYKDSENDLFYNEQSLKYAIMQASKEFSNNGGVKLNCNMKWIFGDQNCNPDLEENFKEILKNNFKKYNLELDNLEINNNILDVKLKDRIYSNKLKNFEFNYTIKHEFKQDSIINFNKLNKIKDELDKCDKAIETNKCTQEKSTLNGNTIFFTIENNKNTYSLAPAPGFKKIEFKFKIDNINRKITGGKIF